MVFCNNNDCSEWDKLNKGHNPYFNRWFSAIECIYDVIEWVSVTILILIDGFLQLYHPVDINAFKDGHNPYFNRWFSAINQSVFKNKRIN